jgi:hypothetical protein
MDMRGRMYDPVAARFLSADPVVENVLDAQTWNAYSYVSNRPLSRVDPTGLADPDAAPDWVAGKLGSDSKEGCQGTTEEGGCVRKVTVSGPVEGGDAPNGVSDNGTADGYWGGNSLPNGGVRSAGAEVMQRFGHALRMAARGAHFRGASACSGANAGACFTQGMSPRLKYRVHEEVQQEVEDTIGTGPGYEAAETVAIGSALLVAFGIAATALPANALQAEIAAETGGVLMEGKAAAGAATAAAGAARAAKGNGWVGSLPKPPRGPGSVPRAQRDPQRVWTPAQRAAKRQEQGDSCPGCGTKIDASSSRGHHIERHADGGPTNEANHAEVCLDCHLELHSP